MQQPVPFESVVTPTAVAFMVVVPVASRATAVVVMAPATAMPIVVVPSIVPLPFIAMVFFALSTVPIPMSVVVPFAISARTDDNSSRRFDVHRRRRSVDRIGCIHNPRDANVNADVDMREGDGRCANAKAGNPCVPI
jgi:hypothetical protein